MPLQKDVGERQRLKVYEIPIFGFDLLEDKNRLPLADSSQLACASSNLIFRFGLIMLWRMLHLHYLKLQLHASSS